MKSNQARESAATEMIQQIAGTLLALMLVATPAIGDDFQVNTYTTDHQRYPSVALDADGDFVVVWESDVSGGSDSSFQSIQGQRYASDGSTAGAEFQVNTYTTSTQHQAVVAAGAGGDFIVAWTGYGSPMDSSRSSIKGQRYASDGSTVGGEFQVNTYTTEIQRQPALAADAGGAFVVVWTSFGSSGTDTDETSIQGQRYASDGSAAGGELQDTTYTTDSQMNPSVALDADGDFVVVWESVGSAGTDSSSFSIQGQRYASSGSSAGGEFQVNTYTTDKQRQPALAADAGGGFVVAWTSLGSGGADTDETSVQGQRYASDGSSVGGEFQVNTYFASRQDDPSVALGSLGDFVVVWESYSDTSDDFIQAQLYASDGSSVGGELQGNTYTTAAQRQPAVAADADGDFVVVWQSLGSGGSDLSGLSVQGQRVFTCVTDLDCDDGLFCNGEETCGAVLLCNLEEICEVVLDCQAGVHPCPSPTLACDEPTDMCVDAIFTDGFEAGDTSVWSSSVL